MKVYVVTEVEFQYNDEIYYASDGEGGEPVEVFANKEAAEKAIEKLTLNWLKTTKLQDYGYEIDEIFSLWRLSTELEISEEDIQQAWNDYEFDALLEGKEDKAVEAFKLKLYKITELELNEAATTR